MRKSSDDTAMRAVSIEFLWLIIAPFGWPVVPEV